MELYPGPKQEGGIYRIFYKTLTAPWRGALFTLHSSFWATRMNEEQAPCGEKEELGSAVGPTLSPERKVKGT